MEVRKILDAGVTNTFGEFPLASSPVSTSRKSSRCLLCSHLAAEIGEEYNIRQEQSESTDDLLSLGLRLVPFLLSHNGEADAVDLLLELEAIREIIPFVDSNTFPRVCLYMVSCVSLLPPPDDVEFLKTARVLYRKHQRFTEALTLSIRLQDTEAIKEDFEAPTNPLAYPL